MSVINKICLIIAILQSVFWSWNLSFMGFLEFNEETLKSSIFMIFLSFIFLIFCILIILYLFFKKKKIINISVALFAINVVFLYFIPNKTIKFEIPTYIILKFFTDTYFWYFLCFFFYDFLYWFVFVWLCLNIVKFIRVS